MRPTNAVPWAKAAEVRRRLSGQTANKAAGKPLNGYREERLIEEKYTQPEPGVHILEVPCYLPTTNEQLNLTKPIRSKKTGKMITRHYLLNEWRQKTRGNILAAFARHLPHMCVDDSRSSGRAKKLRDSVHLIVLSRIAPRACDDDNAVGAVKGVRDTVCAWLVNGPIFDVNRIGEFDEIIYSPVNPHGRVELIVDQIVRKAVPMKSGLPSQLKKAMRANGEGMRMLAGNYGVQIQLNLKDNFSI
jgi:hypothetical protein